MDSKLDASDVKAVAYFAFAIGVMIGMAIIALFAEPEPTCCHHHTHCEQVEGK